MGCLVVIMTMIVIMVITAKMVKMVSNKSSVSLRATSSPSERLEVMDRTQRVGSAWRPGPLEVGA